jgi:hypothetical protein
MVQNGSDQPEIQQGSSTGNVGCHQNIVTGILRSVSSIQSENISQGNIEIGGHRQFIVFRRMRSIIKLFLPGLFIGSLAAWLIMRE